MSAPYQLIKASTFASRYFSPDDQPDLRTVRAWVKDGYVAGEIIGSTVYVDESKWLARRAGVPSATEQANQTFAYRL